MHLFRELERRQERGEIINVAVVGAGAMGRGIAAQVNATAGMRPAVIANRHPERAIAAYHGLGSAPDGILCSNDPRALEAAIEAGLPAVTADALLAATLPAIDVVVESTGTVEHAAGVALAAIESNKHVIAMNAEMDSTVGCLLAERARRHGVVYSYADGDQPGVLMRMIEWIEATGFELVAAVNCKGFMDVSATPDSICGHATRMKTGARMVCAFTDGTKMNMENAVVANATGCVPERRGMHGVRTSLEDALAAFGKRLHGRRVVDYTLGGDFGGGVFVIGRSEDWDRVGHYLEYLKMGSGPEYLFFRPYHLCHLEAPLSIAEAVLYGEATVAPRGSPVVAVIAVAKRDLAAGEMLDGIGGFTSYGEIDTVERSSGLLPMGLTEGARLNAPVGRGEPIPLAAVDLDPARALIRLWNEQATTFRRGAVRTRVTPSRRRRSLAATVR